MNETYDFSFERGQLMKVVGGLLLLVVLVFSAGLFTGVALQMRDAAPTLVAETPKPQPAAAPVPPAPQLVKPTVEAPPEEDQPAVEASTQTADNQTDDIDPNAPAVEDTPAESKVAEDAGKFAVQFGAFLQRENAGVLARRLASKGYDAGVVAREDSHGRTWYLVRYGIFSNRAEATALAVELKSREKLDALVRPSNSM